MKGALSDITIIDLSRVLAGPVATTFAADMGANVIKIENPDGGDDTRVWPPMDNNESHYFATYNRNKRSVTMNLKEPKAREMLKEMVKKADVLVENFRPGVMEKMGLGYEELAKINPRLVYACASGYGTYGPYAQRPGYDLIAQAMSGIMSITGFSGQPPVRVGAPLGDIMCAYGLLIGVLAAVNEAKRTGKGQFVEIALVDTLVSLVATSLIPYYANGTIGQRIGNQSVTLAPYDLFSGSDGDFILACGNQKLYELLCDEVIHKPELKTDARFTTMKDRAANQVALKPLIEEWTRQHTVEECVNAIMAAGIPVGPIYNVAQVANDEHIAKVREMRVPMQHPVLGDITVTGNPIKMAAIKPEEWTPAPLLGQHTEAVLQEMLGMDAAEVQALREKGVV
ncbi:MAG: CaiB/BaiF CoA transferase family protein [Oscillospiraceae bacterium]